VGWLKWRQESKAIEQAVEALKHRLDVLRGRPAVAGRAAEAVRAQESEAIAAELDRLERRAEALPTAGSTRYQWVWAAILGLVIPVGTTLMWTYGQDGADAESNYFEAAAQVIPILVVAAALEGRLFDWSSLLPEGFKVANVLNLCWMAAGEAAALVALAEGHATDVTFGLTSAALVNGGVTLGLIAVLGSLQARADATSTAD